MDNSLEAVDAQWKLWERRRKFFSLFGNLFAAKRAEAERESKKWAALFWKVVK